MKSAFTIMRAGLLVGTIPMLIWSSPVMAQTTAASNDGADTTADTGEIIVTAQRRAERLQDVPLSIQALTGESLEDKQISSFADLQRVSPGLIFNQASSPRSSGTIIRGIGTNTFSDAVEGAVGIIIDGVVIGRQGAGFSDFADVERVEVLRGPQGISFGKNASAGVISIVTKRPSETLSGTAFASYGSDNEIKVNGSVSGPIVGDKILGRVTGFISRRDGIIANVNDGRDLNDVDDWGVRAKLEFRPSDTLNILISGDWSERQPDCCTWTTRSYGISPALRAAEAAAGIVAGSKNRETTLGGRLFTRQESRGVSGEINLDIGENTLTSITAYRRWDAIDNNDADRTPLALLDLNQGDVNQRQFTQEVRFASPGGQRLEYVLGAFYFNQQIVNNSLQRGTFGIALPPGLALSRRQFTEVDTTNYAVFGQGSLEILEGFKLLAGARYTHEKIGIDFVRDTLPGTLTLSPAYSCTRANPATCGPTGPQPGVPSSSDSSWSWRAGVQYQPTRDLNVFATVTRGYKGAAFNSQIDVSLLQRVQPEIPTSYEAGFKSTFLDGGLTFNANLFKTEFKNFQAEAVTINPVSNLLTFTIVNAGKLETKGLELELSMRPTQGLVFDANFAYTDASFKQFLQGPCYTGQTAAQGCVTQGAQRFQNLSGRQLPNSPNYIISVSGRYDFPVAGNWNAFVQGAVFHRSATLTALSQDPNTRQRGYELVDGALGITDPGDTFTLSLFGKNMFDTQYVETIFGTPLDTGGYSQFIGTNARRTWGVSLAARF